MEDVRAALARARTGAAPFALLVGEGCSTTAGIPTPEELVFLLRKDYPDAYRRAREKNLAGCLAELTPVQKRGVVERYLDRAQVNPAHLALAQLLQAGYVDRILTTNFDPLLLRACALLGEFPAVYDLTACCTLDSVALPDQAIVYLKGQRTRLVHQPRAEALRAAFDEAGTGRDWLVVGYDGLVDPVFEHLGQLPLAGQELYWVGVGNGQEAPEHVAQHIRGHYIPGHSPDAFLVALVRALGDFAEDFSEELLEHPHSALETVRPLSLLRAPQPKELSASDELGEIQEADRLAERAQIRAKREADALFEQAYARYAQAALLNPGDPVVYTHWGNALTEQAKVKTGAEAEHLLAQACQKYSRAASLLPLDAQTEYLWGLALSRRAQLTRGETSEQLLRDAMVHLSNAEDRNPGSAAYVLACLCGARQDATQVRLWLTRGKVAGTLPIRSTVENATALRAFAQEPWFVALFSTA